MDYTKEHDSSITETEDAVISYLLGALSIEEAALFESHVQICKVCTDELASVAEVLGRLYKQSVKPGRESNRRVAFQRSIKGIQSRDPVSAILLAKDGLLASRSDLLPWTESPIEGVSAKTLFVDEERHVTTSLVKMAPGTTYPSHRHAGVEEVYMLDGDLQVEGVSLGRGDYCRAGVGSCHSLSQTVGGCLLVLIASTLDEVISS